MKKTLLLSLLISFSALANDNSTVLYLKNNKRFITSNEVAQVPKESLSKLLLFPDELSKQEACLFTKLVDLYMNDEECEESIMAKVLDTLNSLSLHTLNSFLAFNSAFLMHFAFKMDSEDKLDISAFWDLYLTSDSDIEESECWLQEMDMDISTSPNTPLIAIISSYTPLMARFDPALPVIQKYKDFHRNVMSYAFEYLKTKYNVQTKPDVPNYPPVRTYHDFVVPK